MTAHEKLAQGSYGYFIAEGDTRAADRIMSYVNDPDYDKYFNLGNEADATSLDNMKKSLEFLKECNELMEREGLTPFVVNNEQMALAQIGTNVASVTGDHSGEVGAENLAWGSFDILGTSPYDAWYDHEKELYESGERDWHKVGHYLNLIGDNRITGFAFHSPVWDEDGHFVYSQTYGQTFGYDQVTAPEQIRTLEDYTKRFMDYYNKVYDDLNGEQAALDALNAAKDNLAAAQKDVDAANANALTAKDALNTASRKKNEQQSVVDGTQTQLDQETEDLNAKTQKQQEAQIAYQNAVAEVENTTNELEQAKQNCENKKATLAETLQQLEDAKVVTEAKKQALEVEMKHYENVTGKPVNQDTIPTVKEAEELLVKAKDAKEAAQKALDDAKSNEVEKRNALSKVNEEMTEAIKIAAEKQGIYDVCEANRIEILKGLQSGLLDKENAMKKAQEDLNDAKDKLASIEEDIKEAQKTYDEQVKCS